MISLLLLQSAYPTMLIFIGAGLWVLVTKVALPAIRAGLIGKYMIGVGGTFVTAALAHEVVLYGPGRWNPEWAWIGNIFALALLAKAGLICGHLMILASIVEPNRRVERLGWLCLAALGVWAIWLGVAYWMTRQGWP